QRSQDRHLDEIARQYDLPKNDREFLEIYSKPFVGTDAGAILPELTRSYGEHYIRTRQGSAKPMSEEVDFQAIERYLRSDPDF
ncbi:hypothetical protein, partial [Enterococcus faecium]|uniref:hypothetical protein n=1 Tax=Enterococcus faecium TaxID=1352 RepID=UPI003F434125